MTRCSRSLECVCKRSFRRNAILFLFLLEDAFSSGFVFVVFPCADTYWQFHLKTGVDDTETLLMMEEDVAAPCCCGAWGTYVRIYEDMTGGFCICICI